MHYQKIEIDNIIIEFHNNWLGVETVTVNGRRVSQKSSVWGIDHRFKVYEGRSGTSYSLNSKVGANMGVYLDLYRNGQLVRENIAVGTSFFGKNNGGQSFPIFNLEAYKAKKKGLKQLMDYDLQDALKSFDEALVGYPDDAEIYFHMACAFSLLENIESGFEHLRLAVFKGLKDTEQILTHEMLAFLRIQHAFEGFFESGFTEYDLSETSDH